MSEHHVPEAAATAREGSDLPRLRDRKKARTRQIIIHTALRLFNERGYENTTVEAIAEAAEVAPTTVFRYFETKENIAFSERRRQLPALRQGIIDAPEDLPGIVAVRAAYVELTGQPEYDFERVRLLRSAIERSASLRAAGYVVMHEYVDTIASALDERAGEEQLHLQHLATARLFMASLDLAYLQCSQEQGLADYVAAIDRSWEFMRASLHDGRRRARGRERI